MVAHAGGIDELAIFLFPIVFGLGFWLIIRQRKPAEDERHDGSPKDIPSEAKSPRIPQRRQDGAARLRTLMDARSTSAQAEPPPIPRRRKDVAARLRTLMDAERPPAGGSAIAQDRRGESEE